jgi:hypothetical protein
MVKQKLKTVNNRLRSFEPPHSAVLWVDTDVSKKYGDSFRGKELCPRESEIVQVMTEFSF